MIDTLTDFTGNVGETGPAAPDGRQYLGVPAGGRKFLPEHPLGVLEEHAPRSEGQSTQVLVRRCAGIPLPEVKRISPASCIRLQQV